MPDGALYAAEFVVEYEPETITAGLKGTTQIGLEQLYSKYQLHECIAREFRAAGLDAELVELGIPEQFGIDLLVQMQLHKRATVATLVGLLRRHFEHEENPAQACADMILYAAEQDAIEIIDGETPMAVVVFTIDEDTQAKLDRFQYPLPMIEPPRPVYHNKQTGYRTIRGSLILKKNHHDDDICLDHINRVNAIPLRLNPEVVAFVQNRWRHLDKIKPGETLAEFKKRKRAFAKYDESSRDVLSAMMEQGDRLWLTHRYDKRGRTYAQGYHVTYQGNDWNKACIELADAEPLNEE